MLLKRPHVIALTQFNLWVISLIVLLWFGMFTIELFYIIVFLGLLVTVHLFAPADRNSSWYVTLTLLTRLGFLGLAYIVFRRVTELIQF